MRGYAVAKLALSIQGLGVHLGRPALFIRFSGCNLWSGLERDRARAMCRFCDASFRTGLRYSAPDLADAAADLWLAGGSSKFAVLTGGEPLLQFDRDLFRALRQRGFRKIAVETNGSVPFLCDERPDWITLSPKAEAPLVIDRADELILAYPQPGLAPEDLSGFDAPIRWLCPIDGPRLVENTKLAAEYCLRRPPWRLAVRAGKVWGLD